MKRIFGKIKDKINAFLHNNALKRKLYVIIFESDTPAGKAFDIFLILFILFSIVVVVLESIRPFWNEHKSTFRILEYIISVVFTIEYLARIYCSPNPKKYITSFFGIVDLLSTLPIYLSFFFGGARYLLIIRAFRLIRIFRVFRLFNFLNEGQLLLNSLKESSRKITVFFLFVVILVVSIGTIMYMIEGSVPGTQFNNIPNSIYWAIVTMTTVGYGDITPLTPVGRFLSATVMLIGYTIIAVPTGIVSVSMMKHHQKLSQRKCPNCHKSYHEDGAAYCNRCGTKLPEIPVGSKRKYYKTGS